VRSRFIPPPSAIAFAATAAGAFSSSLLSRQIGWPTVLPAHPPSLADALGALAFVSVLARCTLGCAIGLFHISSSRASAFSMCARFVSRHCTERRHPWSSFWRAQAGNGGAPGSGPLGGGGCSRTTLATPWNAFVV
jgi:hypothetical protein